MEFQWWCAAQTAAWEWKWQPYPGVWLFIALLAFGYSVLLRRAAREAGATVRATISAAAGSGTPGAPGVADTAYAPDGMAAGGSGASGWRIASFGLGLACLWLALDWPIGALGAGYLASVHMIQFLLIAMLAPPLLAWGTPPAACRALEGDSAFARAFRFATHPLIAIVTFLVITGITHTPAVTDTLMASQIGSFVIDIAWLAGGLLFWWPVAAAVPARPNFHELLRIVYMTGLAIGMTPVFLFLTFSGHPVYAIYELAPPVHGIEPLADQQVAGLIMKVAGGFILMGALTILFLRWAQRSGDDPAALQRAAASAHSPTGEPVAR